MDQNSEYLWLKQSVTFTVNGQTRTVEIALPLRPGATADEVEALLSEADAGMERLSRHMDARVAAISGNGAPASPPPSTAAPVEPGHALTTPDTQPTPVSHTPAPEPKRAAEPVSPNSSRPPATSAPARPTPPAPSSARPTPPAPEPSRQSQPSRAAQAELSRPDFIAALKEIDLDVRQAMQRLGVRSLEGLNLREALEALRRQTLRAEDDAASAKPVPSTSRPSSAQEEPPHYFEEEDEPDMTFTVAGDDEPEDELPYEEGAAGGWDNDADDLDDVPDFGPPPTSRRAPSAGHTPTPPPSRPARGVPPGPHSEPVEHAAPATGENTRAAQLLTRLRAAQGGGVPTSQQRTAYRNIIVQEVGETMATALVRGVWRVTPERLGPEQMDELLSWGKQDTFSDDAQIVIAELRAERERAATAAPADSGAARPAARPRTRPLSAPDHPGGS